MHIESVVLWSGGVDSTVLLADELSQGRRVQPLHIRCGLAWEPAEARCMARLLARPPFTGRVAGVATLDMHESGRYAPDHWAVRGTPPAYDSPDEAVYLEDRNVRLISAAAGWCRQHGVDRLTLGSLAGNPFPDATPAFFTSMSRSLSASLHQRLEVVAPFLTRTKRDVVARGLALGVPLELTMSCMNPTPVDGHCGACSKCRERDRAIQTPDD